MPIRADLRKFYGREWREVTRPRILARACWRCERCGKPDGAKVLVLPEGLWYDDQWKSPLGEVAGLWRAPYGKLPADLFDRIKRGTIRRIRVMVGVAHLDHDHTNGDDSNLAALCQRCHIVHDAQKHSAAAHETRATRKDAARPLLRELEQAS